MGRLAQCVAAARGDLAWGAIYLSLALLLYAPVLDAFPIGDDLSILAHTHLGGRGFASCWLPMTNGFWRPLGLSAAWVLARLFGAAPVAFHLLPVVLHAANAVLFRRAALDMGWSRRGAAFAGAFFAAHFAAFPAVSAMQNSMDVMLGAATLLVLRLARWNERGVPFAGLAAVFALGMASKETAVVLPFAAAAVWWSTAPGGRWREGRAAERLGVLCLLGVLAAVAVAMLQATYSDSYFASDMVRRSPVEIFGKQIEYVFSAAFPYFYVARMPWDFVVLAGTPSWALSAGAAIVGVAAALDPRRARWRGPFGLLLVAAMVVAPPSVVSAGLGGRFVYAAIAPVLLAAGEAIRRADSRRARATAWGVAVASTLLSGTAFFASPTVGEYVECAKNVEHFVEDCRREASSWPPGAHISVHGHPHPGSGALRWVYCQMLFDLFLPETDAIVFLDRPGIRTARTYRFHNGYLRVWEPPAAEE